jgi:hypothetical protein
VNTAAGACHHRSRQVCPHHAGTHRPGPGRPAPGRPRPRQRGRTPPRVSPLRGSRRGTSTSGCGIRDTAPSLCRFDRLRPVYLNQRSERADIRPRTSGSARGAPGHADTPSTHGTSQVIDQGRNPSSCGQKRSVRERGSSGTLDSSWKALRPTSMIGTLSCADTARAAVHHRPTPRRDLYDERVHSGSER